MGKMEEKAKAHGAYYTQRNEGSGRYQAKDELLHPEAREYEPGPTMTETQYFGITIPEEKIHGLTYLWCHPNFKLVSGGTWVFQGMKGQALSSELFDWQNHMTENALKNDLHDYTLDNRLRVQIIEPGEKFRVEYHDDERKNHVDVEYTAVMPPYMFASNKHFEQTMKTKGEVVLRGRTYKVNGYTVRDRSWGQLRNETLEPMPPMTWMSGVFNDDFSFCCSGFDHPDITERYKGVEPMPADRVFSGGFIRRNGETRDLVNVRKRTVRNPATLYPESIEMELTDSKGDKHVFKGAIIAASYFSNWWNLRSVVCLTRWECDGLVGHGDAQDMHWADFFYHNMPTP